MDEAAKEVVEDNNFTIESINDESFLFRLVSVRNTDKQQNRRFPNEAAFSLRENEAGLSLNWNKYCCERKSLIVRGLTATLNDPSKFIDVSPNVVFKLPSYFLKDYGELRHTPIYQGNPSPIGRPNNISHFELFPSAGIELKMRMDLADYCKNEFENSFCSVQMPEIKIEIEEWKQKENDTPYHKNWVFE